MQISEFRNISKLTYYETTVFFVRAFSSTPVGFCAFCTTHPPSTLYSMKHWKFGISVDILRLIVLEFDVSVDDAVLRSVEGRTNTICEQNGKH